MYRAVKPPNKLATSIMTQEQVEAILHTAYRQGLTTQISEAGVWLEPTGTVGELGLPEISVDRYGVGEQDRITQEVIEEYRNTAVTVVVYDDTIQLYHTGETK